MTIRIAQALARLASEKFHERYIRNATKDEYILPNELFETEVYAIENILSHSNDHESFSEAEIQSLQDFVTIAKKHADTIPWDGKWDEIIASDGWQKMRQAALKCAESLSVDPDKIELE